jgi:molecular chaperone GrpE
MNKDKNIQNDDDLKIDDNDIEEEEEREEEVNEEEEEMNDEENEDNNEEKECEDKLEKCLKERNEYLSGWQRQKADFMNYQKGEKSRMEEIVKFSNEDLIYQLLVVLDSFDISINSFDVDSLSENEEKILKGVEVIRNQFENILKQKGLEVIESLEEKFNPIVHEAIEKEDNQEGELIVSEVVLKGYKLNGKVIRPAKVKVKIKKVE